MPLPDSYDKTTRARSSDPAEAAYYDMPGYRKCMTSFVALLPKNPFVVDLGCGDGRMTELLGELGVTRIESHVDALEKPFNKEADGVVMTEAAYALDDPSKGYLNASKWLKKGGFAFVSNPCWETYFVHALMNGDLEQIERVKQSRYYHEEHDSEVTLLTLQGGGSMAANVGLKCISSAVINGHVSLLIHMLRDMGKDPGEYTALLNYFSMLAVVPGIPRLFISMYVKEV